MIICRIFTHPKFCSQRIGTRFDCGNQYTLVVELFKQNSETPFFTKQVEVENFPDGGPYKWKKVCSKLLFSLGDLNLIYLKNNSNKYSAVLVFNYLSDLVNKFFEKSMCQFSVCFSGDN